MSDGKTNRRLAGGAKVDIIDIIRKGRGKYLLNAVTTRVKLLYVDLSEVFFLPTKSLEHGKDKNKTPSRKLQPGNIFWEYLCVEYIVLPSAGFFVTFLK